MKDKTILAVFAHPDDEAFGPGGSIAKWANEGAKIYLLCATKGESGQNAGRRDKELKAAAKVLGIKKVEFLGFKDGRIGNNDLQKLEKIITKKIEELKPEILLTYDLNGISGHLDHIAVASATSQAFKKSPWVKYLYHFAILKEFTDLMEKEFDYFIFRPEGKKREEIDLVVDVAPVWDQKLKAMYQHQSQVGDIKRITKIRENFPKKEHFLIKSKI